VTLADLLAALAVLGLVLTATVTLLGQGQELAARGAGRVEAQQHARVALARLAAELRQAGQGPGGGDWSPVSVAEPTRVVIHHDLDGDGAVDGRGETITWRLAGAVLRRDAGGGAQPVINGVRALVLRYFDAAGRPTTIAAAVQMIEIELVTAPAAARPDRPAVARVATRVSLRNR